MLLFKGFMWWISYICDLSQILVDPEQDEIRVNGKKVQTRSAALKTYHFVLNKPKVREEAIVHTHTPVNTEDITVVRFCYVYPFRAHTRTQARSHVLIACAHSSAGGSDRKGTCVCVCVCVSQGYICSNATASDDTKEGMRVVDLLQPWLDAWAKEPNNKVHTHTHTHSHLQ